LKETVRLLHLQRLLQGVRKMSGAMNSETNRTLGFGKIKTKTLVEDEKRKTT